MGRGAPPPPKVIIMFTPDL